MDQIGHYSSVRWLFALAILLLMTSLACDVVWMFAPPFLPSWLAGLLVLAATIAAILAVAVTSTRVRTGVREHLLALAMCVGYLSLAVWHLVVRVAAEFESDGGYFVVAAVTILLTIHHARANHARTQTDL